MSDTHKSKAKNTRVPAAPAPEVRERCVNLVDVTALAWVSVLRSRLHDLERMLDRVTSLRGHPASAGAAVLVNAALDEDILSQIYTHVEDAETLAKDLLRDASNCCPELAATCRQAAREMGLGD